jgi:hypothetical protein
MTFWNTLPTQPFYRKQIPSPTSVPAEYWNANTLSHSPSLEQEVRHFLFLYFGNPPHTPRLCLPSPLLSTHDDLVLVRNTDGRMVGCVRYREIGPVWSSLSSLSSSLSSLSSSLLPSSPSSPTSPTSPTTFMVDAFCIHPTERKKGIGAYLLHELHRYANSKGNPYALFLKEGWPLPTLWLPAYTGQYVYRRCDAVIPLSPLYPLPSLPSLPSLQPLTVSQATAWVQAYLTCFPSTLFMGHIRSTGQHWWGYRHNGVSVIICVQDTYQRIGNESIGWVTAWLESSSLTEVIREHISLQLCSCASPYVTWLWSQTAWTGTSPYWKSDGWFHWYSYQWTPTIGTSYGILNR